MDQTAAALAELIAGSGFPAPTADGLAAVAGVPPRRALRVAASAVAAARLARVPLWRADRAAIRRLVGDPNERTIVYRLRAAAEGLPAGRSFAAPDGGYAELLRAAGLDPAAVDRAVVNGAAGQSAVERRSAVTSYLRAAAAAGVDPCRTSRAEVRRLTATNRRASAYRLRAFCDGQPAGERWTALAPKPPRARREQPMAAAARAAGLAPAEAAAAEAAVTAGLAPRSAATYRAAAAACLRDCAARGLDPRRLDAAGIAAFARRTRHIVSPLHRIAAALCRPRPE